MKKLTLLFLSIILYNNANAIIKADPTHKMAENVCKCGSFADVIEKITPAVVNISTTQKIKESNKYPKLLPPEGRDLEELFEFFAPFFGPLENPNSPKTRHSLGSGFIIDPKGYVVTNRHVIENADEIIVSFNEEKDIKAKLIGFDDKTDLALLKIDLKKDLPYIKFADSDQSRVGDWVIAVGNPFGLNKTVTSGIISARGRDINVGPYDDFLQTDAAVNSGNSGGPLVNLNGEVVGVNTAIYSPSGGSIGIGFAIPSNITKPVIEQLKNYGHIKRGWLGVEFRPITKEIKESLNLKNDDGIFVNDVSRDGPAFRAGVQPGDIITKYNNEKLNSTKKLPRMVAETEIGKVVELEVLRNGKLMTIKVKIEQSKNDEQALISKDKIEETDFAGMDLSDLDPIIRKDYDLPKDMNGILVKGVVRGSLASRNGIKPGQVIVSINQLKINSVKEFKSILQQAKKDNKKHVMIELKSKNKTDFMLLPIQK